MDNKIDARSLGLPHDTFRPNQYEAYIKASNKHNNGGGFMFFELATGSGKSGVATALGANDKVTVLCQNHGLMDQYEKMYGFETIKGKQEYPCALLHKVKLWKEKYGKVPTAADCHEIDPHECPEYDSCPYYIQRDIAFASRRMCCTYKYASLSEKLQQRSGILVMDEAHLSADELLEFYEFRITDETCKTHGFPKFPFEDYGNGEGDIACIDTRNLLRDWFNESISKVANIDLFDRLTYEGAKQKQISEVLQKGLKILNSEDDIFLKSNKKNRYETGFMMIKPMGASVIARDLFSNKKTVILMSATIGNPKPLATELGIRGYEFIEFDHPIPVEYRPVYDLKVEKMTKANIDSNPRLLKFQAETIINFINSLDKNWRGIILTSSNLKIKFLRNEIATNLPGRLFVPKQGQSLSQRIDDFVNNTEKGKIVVDTIQGWGSGISLDYDIARFAIVAGIDFPNPGDKYDSLRMQRPNGKEFGFGTAYSGVAQAIGRVSRGEKYPDGTYMKNVAALADGSATTKMAKFNYPKWMRNAIMEW